MIVLKWNCHSLLNCYITGIGAWIVSMLHRSNVLGLFVYLRRRDCICGKRCNQDLADRVSVLSLSPFPFLPVAPYLPLFPTSPLNPIFPFLKSRMQMRFLTCWVCERRSVQQSCVNNWWTAPTDWTIQRVQNSPKCRAQPHSKRSHSRGCASVEKPVHGIDESCRFWPNFCLLDKSFSTIPDGWWELNRICAGCEHLKCFQRSCYFCTIVSFNVWSRLPERISSGKIWMCIQLAGIGADLYSGLRTYPISGSLRVTNCSPTSGFECITKKEMKLWETRPPGFGACACIGSSCVFTCRLHWTEETQIVKLSYVAVDPAVGPKFLYY